MKSYLYKGKEVYIISENDLQVTRQLGRSYRALCPIHNSRDSDASIHGYRDDMSEDEAMRAGWGKCFGISCNAVILVKEWNPSAVYWVTGSKYAGSSEPKMHLDLAKIELSGEWQLYELQALEKLYPTMVQRLDHPRSIDYLTQRYGVPMERLSDVLHTLGAGYVPPLEEWTTTPQQICQKLFKNTENDYSWVLNKWCDRLIFPFTTPDQKRGFSGRSMHLWVSGMDENEHKKILNELDKQYLASGTYNPYRRYEKTYRNGIINAAAFKNNRTVRMCESGFDAIPWLLEHYDNTVAASGSSFSPEFIPANVRHITIAFDADIKQPTVDALKENLGRAGFTSDLSVPPIDNFGKDWCERYRHAGLAGLVIPFRPISEPLPADPVQLVTLQDFLAGLSPEDQKDFLTLPEEEQVALIREMNGLEPVEQPSLEESIA